MIRYGIRGRPVSAVTTPHMRCTTGSFQNNTFKLVTGWAPGVNPGCSGILRRYIFRENYDLGVWISRSIFFYCLNLASRAQFRQYRVSWPSCGPDQHTAVLVWPTGLPAIVRRADWVDVTHGPARATTLASRECQGSARRLAVPGSRPDKVSG